MAADDFKGDSLRQRLVGGIALLIIGLIAWFWLLSADSPVDPVSRASQIPATPDIKPFAVPEPTPPAQIAPIDSASDSQPALRADIAAGEPAAVAESQPQPNRVAPISNVTRTPPVAQTPNTVATPATKPMPEKPLHAGANRETFELDQHGLPVAWVVQVGLFSTQASADKIKAALQQHGFKAYTEPYKAPNAPAGVKVFVGPKLSRERADEQKRAIDAALKVNSIVVRFQSPQR